ncbi:MAG TPA: tetratricopeptide repeat protein, partial [Candidatus Limnocylindria bacterium]|nr:tetratricopeptide repeat protein [Candidatus Limnocylindria bacterium]
LAGERYTKAYVSALETGIARPSMVALSYLSERLSLPASHFIDENHPAWTRLEVDMQLAAGEWQAAADGYRSLLENAPDEMRADLLRGLAEASARLDHGKETIAAASEAARLYAEAGREPDAALARYWLAYGLYQSDNEPDARSVLTALLEQVRGGLQVEPDFEMRLLTSLAAVESHTGQAARALTYLEEARGLAADLDDRRRAAFLFNLAIGYREVGDFEAAIRSGTQGMALYRAAGAIFESARIENDLALAYLATGQVDRARELAADARRQIEATGDERWLAAVLDTEAQVALASGSIEDALRLTAAARATAARGGNEYVGLVAMITEARALRQAGRDQEAEERFVEAARIARASRVPHRLREVLRDWADLRAERGDHRGAYELTSEALKVN